MLLLQRIAKLSTCCYTRPNHLYKLGDDRLTVFGVVTGQISGFPIIMICIAPADIDFRDGATGWSEESEQTKNIDFKRLRNGNNRTTSPAGNCSSQAESAATVAVDDDEDAEERNASAPAADANQLCMQTMPRRAATHLLMVSCSMPTERVHPVITTIINIIVINQSHWSSGNTPDCSAPGPGIESRCGQLCLSSKPL